jgi:hypothetical protein
MLFCVQVLICGWRSRVGTQPWEGHDLELLGPVTGITERKSGVNSGLRGLEISYIPYRKRITLGVW